MPVFRTRALEVRAEHLKPGEEDYFVKVRGHVAPVVLTPDGPVAVCAEDWVVTTRPDRRWVLGPKGLKEFCERDGVS